MADKEKDLGFNSSSKDPGRRNTGPAVPQEKQHVELHPNGNKKVTPSTNQGSWFQNQPKEDVHETD